MIDEQFATHRKAMRQCINRLEKEAELYPKPPGRVKIDLDKLSDLPYGVRLRFAVDVLRGFDTALDILAEIPIDGEQAA